MKRKSPDEITAYAFALYKELKSLRDVVRKVSIPRSTLSDRFIKFYGRDYVKDIKCRGVMRILKEYTLDSDLTLNQRWEVAQFIEENHALLKSLDNYSDTDLYNDRELKNIAKSDYYSSRSKEWRDHFEYQTN